MQINALKYRPDIDGLRAVAILPVLVYHAKFPLIHGGYIGVDIFFVISGYLITSILVGDLKAGSFSLIKFYERRARRILLPLFVVAAVCVPAAWLLFLPADFALLGKTLIAVGVFCPNFLFWTQGGYFDAPLEANPLLHTWSLAVEEQFYLFFPLLLAFVYRRWRGGLIKLTVAGLLVSLVASVWLTAHDSRTAFYMLLPRGWELLAGGLLAARQYTGLPWQYKGPAWIPEALAVLALLAMVGPMFLYTPQTPFPGLAAIPPCLGAAIMIWLPTALEKPTFGSRLVSLKPLVGIGLISYSLYLWHWPVLVFMKDFFMLGYLPRKLALVGLLFSFLIAWLSWRFIELPIRERRICITRQAMFRCAGVLLGAMIVGGSIPYFLDGIPGRLPPEAQPYVRTLENENLEMNAECQIANPNQAALERVQRGDICHFGKPSRGDGPVVFTWGDSHMGVLRPLFQKIIEEHSLSEWHLATLSRLPLLDSYREHFDTSSQKAYFPQIAAAIVKLIQTNRIPVVVLGGYWTTRAEEDLRTVTDDHQVLRGYEALAWALEKTVTTLEQGGAEVWIIKSVPIYKAFVPQRLIRDIQLGRDPRAFFQPFAEHQRKMGRVEKIFADLAAGHPRLKFIDPGSRLCPDGEKCLTSLDDQPLYFDSNHLTTVGALYLEPAFEELIKSLARHKQERLAEPD